MRRAALMLAVVLCCTGCVQGVNIDDQSYALILGIDRGENARYKLTVAGPNMGASAEQANSSGMYYAAMEDDSIYGAVNLINVSMPFKVNYLHTNYIAVSEEIAKSGELTELLMNIMDLMRVKRTSKVFVTSCSAEDFVSGLSSTLDRNFAKSQKTLAMETKLSGLFVDGDMRSVFESVKHGLFDKSLPLGAFNYEAADRTAKRKSDGVSVSGDSDAASKGESGGKKEEGKSSPEPSPKPSASPEEAGGLPREGGLRSEIYGAALFSRGKMVGKLTGEQTLIMMMGKGGYKTGMLDFKSGGEMWPVLVVQRSKPKVRVEFADGAPRAEITVKLEICFRGAGARVMDKQTLDRLDTDFKKYIENGLSEVALICAEKKSDVFGLRKAAIKHAATIQQWENEIRDMEFESAPVKWNVQTKICKTLNVGK